MPNIEQYSRSLLEPSARGVPPSRVLLIYFWGPAPPPGGLLFGIQFRHISVCSARRKRSIHAYEHRDHLPAVPSQRRKMHFRYSQALNRLVALVGTETPKKSKNYVFLFFSTTQRPNHLSAWPVSWQSRKTRTFSDLCGPAKSPCFARNLRFNLNAWYSEHNFKLKIFLRASREILCLILTLGIQSKTLSYAVFFALRANLHV